MAVGDVVNQISIGTGTMSTLQPAAGVELVIFFSSADNTSWVALYNGTTLATKVLDNSVGSVKVPINNTNYVANYATSTNGGLSGIQIK